MVDEKQSNFDRWFANSKVIDGTGKPLTVYHGTTREFTTFTARRGLGGAAGFWFASSKQAAQQYAEPRMRDDMSIVVAVHLALKNPAEFVDYAAFQDSVREHRGANYEARVKALRRSLERSGHDGIVIRNSNTDRGGHRTDYVAFRSEQIKSATSNSGLYNAANPDITDRIAAAGAALDYLSTITLKKAVPHA